MNRIMRFFLEKLRPHAERRTKLVAFATSDRGLVRRDNQASFVCDAPHAFLCVADGMGGGAEGATASRWACDDISAACLAAGDDVAAREDAVGDALKDVNLRIRSYAKEHGYKSMGTTVVGFIANPCDATLARVFHAGDSRIYRFRYGRLDLLTRDHTVGSELGSAMAAGGDSHAQALRARSNPLAHILTRAVGTEMLVRPEWKTVDVQRGDRFLLCSDGVHDMLDDAEIASLLASASTPRVAAARIEAEVLKAGANDNYTILCAYAVAQGAVR